ncbi:hypothetical protein Vafri_3863, partial [Volvox africanus]
RLAVIAWASLHLPLLLSSASGSLSPPSRDTSCVPSIAWSAAFTSPSAASPTWACSPALLGRGGGTMAAPGFSNSIEAPLNSTQVPGATRPASLACRTESQTVNQQTLHPS